MDDIKYWMTELFASGLIEWLKYFVVVQINEQRLEWLTEWRSEKLKEKCIDE